MKINLNITWHFIVISVFKERKKTRIGLLSRKISITSLLSNIDNYLGYNMGF